MIEKGQGKSNRRDTDTVVSDALLRKLADSESSRERRSTKAGLIGLAVVTALAVGAQSKIGPVHHRAEKNPSSATPEVPLSKMSAEKMFAEEIDVSDSALILRRDLKLYEFSEEGKLQVGKTIEGDLLVTNPLETSDGVLIPKPGEESYIKQNGSLDPGKFYVLTNTQINGNGEDSLAEFTHVEGLPALGSTTPDFLNGDVTNTEGVAVSVVTSLSPHVGDTQDGPIGS